jgi:hypothetical protein
MKIAMLAVFLAFNFAAVQESLAFVECGYWALCYSEEIPEDGATPETVPDVVNSPAGLLKVAPVTCPFEYSSRNP